MDCFEAPRRCTHAAILAILATLATLEAVEMIVVGCHWSAARQRRYRTRHVILGGSTPSTLVPYCPSALYLRKKDGLGISHLSLNIRPALLHVLHSMGLDPPDLLIIDGRNVYEEGRRGLSKLVVVERSVAACLPLYWIKTFLVPWRSARSSPTAMYPQMLNRGRHAVSLHLSG